VKGETFVAEGDEARGASARTIRPADFGLDEADPGELAGGDAHMNATVLRRVLAGEDHTPSRAVRAAAVMEAALALVAIGKAADLRDGALQAARAIDNGRAAETLRAWAEASHA
jgi:anthranilate phosphoribosyltransferase